MTTFGLSAFLKVVHLSPRRQRTALRKRLTPSTGGYDYHRSMRVRAKRYLMEGHSIEDVMRSVSEISARPERESARGALEKLALWRAENPYPLFDVPSGIYESPRGIFKVNFNPMFGILSGRRTGVHIWNTKAPDLRSREVHAVLSLFPMAYDTVDGAPENFSVLSLQNSRIYSFMDAPDFMLIGRRLVEGLEELFEDVSDEVQRRDDRREAPPPAPL